MVTSRQHLKLAAPLLVLALGFLAFSFLRRNVAAADKGATTLEGRGLTPAGSLLIDKATGKPAVGAMPMAFVRSPDTSGPNGGGRYLISVNSGYGVQFNGKDKPAQSLAVIDLKADPPVVVQTIYFPSPQSVNVGAVFDPRAGSDGSYKLYVSGGVENKIWIMSFRPGAENPLSPQPGNRMEKVSAPSIDIAALTVEKAELAYNGGRPPVYPTGLALGAASRRLFVANNLADNLGILTPSEGGQWKLKSVDLHRDNKSEFVYPYWVTVLKSDDGKTTRKVYVSCWNTATVAEVDADHPEASVKHIAVANHPTAMLLNQSGSRLFVVNSGADSVSVIDTAEDREIERIDTRLQEKIDVVGNSPESLALSSDGQKLFAANSHSNSVAVVSLSRKAIGGPNAEADGDGDGG
ncbi:MAG TPA: beta-propeller fold lactonase family protein, partial [Blastocatellia bacterium]|nr:beta-propeller fold lactonase family protein [Blastocatellia bacterium]